MKQFIANSIQLNGVHIIPNTLASAHIMRGPYRDNVQYLLNDCALSIAGAPCPKATTPHLTAPRDCNRTRNELFPNVMVYACARRCDHLRVCVDAHASRTNECTPDNCWRWCRTTTERTIYIHTRAMRARPMNRRIAWSSVIRNLFATTYIRTRTLGQPRNPHLGPEYTRNLCAQLLI